MDLGSDDDEEVPAPDAVAFSTPDRPRGAALGAVSPTELSFAGTDDAPGASTSEAGTSCRKRSMTLMDLTFDDDALAKLFCDGCHIPASVASPICSRRDRRDWNYRDYSGKFCRHCPGGAKLLLGPTKTLPMVEMWLNESDANDVFFQQWMCAYFSCKTDAGCERCTYAAVLSRMAMIKNLQTWAFGGTLFGVPFPNSAPHEIVLAKDVKATEWESTSLHPPAAHTPTYSSPFLVSSYLINTHTSPPPRAPSAGPMRAHLCFFRKCCHLSARLCYGAHWSFACLVPSLSCAPVM